MVNSDLIKYPDGWTYDEFDQAAKSMPEQVSFMEGTLHNDMLKIFLSTSLQRFVDYEKKTVDVQNDDMRRLIEMTNEYGVRIIPADEGKKLVTKSDGTEIYEAGIHDFTRDKFNEGILAVRDKSIFAVKDYSLDSNQNQGHVSFIGYPSPVKTGMAVTPQMSLGIVSSGRNKDLAWDFIRAYLMEHADVSCGIDQAMFDVISEEAGGYFAGDRSMDEVLKLISNRASLIVSEY